MISWYPVHTKPQSEGTADRNLRERGFVTFYPFERAKVKRKLPNRHQFKHVFVERPYFPRYLFVGIHDRTPPLAVVNATAGVSTLVYFGDGPLEIPHPVMDELMKRADEGGLVAEKDEVTIRRQRYKAGQVISFKENSPMAGLIAEVSLDNGKEIMAWVSMLGAKRLVSVPPSAIGEIA